MDDFDGGSCFRQTAIRVVQSEVMRMPEDPVGEGPGAVSMRTKEHKRLQRIRGRASYRLFKELYDFLQSSPSSPDILRKVHNILDARYSFGSRKNAKCAAESLDLVLRDRESKMSERCSGNFFLGECFADIKCRHGHSTRLFNVGRDHFVACDSCRTFIHVGSNLMSNWRQESEAEWRRNKESVRGYELVD